MKAKLKDSLLEEINKGKAKDEVLDLLASHHFNIAQFVSFAPYNLGQRFARVHNHDANYCFTSPSAAVTALLENSQERKVNIRTFKSDVTKGNPFKRGLTSAADVLNLIIKYSTEGFFVIVNESIDINDGGVSGVIMGEIIEFTPQDTPKGVDKPGICSLQRAFGLRILEKVYGFSPGLNFDSNYRVEFSIHPLRRGVYKEHTIIWEIEESFSNSANMDTFWPNNFSRFIGDKVFGLLVANELGLNVPHTTIICRNVAPFSFGKDTGVDEVWIRTSPNQKTPGYFPTLFGWTDPFKLMQESDPNRLVNALLSQKSVEPVYSGAMICTNTGTVIEGVEGKGDDFMVGKGKPVDIPKDIKDKITDAVKNLQNTLRTFSFEWVYDGSRVWIVQLNLIASELDSNMIYPGVANYFIEFNVERGLEELRNLVANLDRSDNVGIELKGNVGITSHFGDILRNAKLPSKLTLK